MTLTERIEDLAERVAEEINDIRDEIAAGGSNPLSIDDNEPGTSYKFWFQPSTGIFSILVDGQWVKATRDGLDGEDGTDGEDGAGVVSGGSTGQVLAKKSATDFDTEWINNGAGITEYMMPIWAEENSTLGSNTFEWAFGNGADTPSNNGIAIYVPSGWECHIVAMGATTNNASGSSRIACEVNGTNLNSSVYVQLAGRSAINEMSTPYELSNNDRLNFKTTTSGTNTSPNTVVAYLRFRKTS